MSESNVERVRRGFEAAARGDLDAVAEMLAHNVRWHGAGDDQGGFQNREMTLRWMREGIARGIPVDLLDARDLPDGRVLAVLQRNRPGDDGGDAIPPPHAEILSFDDGKVVEMVVYPTVEDAVRDS